MKSMTGMGRASGMVLGSMIRMEIKSVNHRFCELSVRLPHRFSSVEILLRQHVRNRIARGKMDIQLIEEKSAAVDVLDSTALKSCYEYLNRLRTLFNIKQEISLDHLLSGMSEWVVSDQAPEDVWRDLEPLVERAVCELEKMRADEGGRLKSDISSRFQNLRNIAAQVGKNISSVNAEQKKKLRERITEKLQGLPVGLDENRLAQEVVYLLDRLDVTEELKRLESHLTLAFELLAAQAPIGRKIDFLLQELQREFNTLSNKVQNTVISHLAVDGKVELEKIREQIQNIE